MCSEGLGEGVYGRNVDGKWQFDASRDGDLVGVVGK